MAKSSNGESVRLSAYDRIMPTVIGAVLLAVALGMFASGREDHDKVIAYGIRIAAVEQANLAVVAELKELNKTLNDVKVSLAEYIQQRNGK